MSQSNGSSVHQQTRLNSHRHRQQRTPLPILTAGNGSGGGSYNHFSSPYQSSPLFQSSPWQQNISTITLEGDGEEEVTRSIHPISSSFMQSPAPLVNDIIFRGAAKSFSRPRTESAGSNVITAPLNLRSNMSSGGASSLAVIPSSSSQPSSPASPAVADAASVSFAAVLRQSITKTNDEHLTRWR